MFERSRVAEALIGKRDEFRSAAEHDRDVRECYSVALRGVEALGSSDLANRLHDIVWPGALPTQEFAGGLFRPFGERWRTAQEARSWALETLRGATTVAVDGSQIAASKEFAVPVSLVQVAWFANPHNGDSSYVKDVRNEVIAPDLAEQETQEYAFSESRLNQRRFALEMAVSIEQIRQLAPDPASLVFVDGSLVLSFTGRMTPPARDSYVASLLGLLAASEESRVPVVGYIDLSYARDLVSMLRAVCDLPEGNVFDAQLLVERMAPFDRTAAFVSARGDVLKYYRTSERDWSQDLLFVYMKVGQDRLPVRIDFPRWILDADLLDRVLDLIRAEIVVGSGYPYALETADAAAVLSLDDRLQFYRLFHEFAGEAGLQVLLPGKSISKMHRR